MFGLDPLSRSVAVVEMLLLLGAAALIGWLLGRWVRNGRVHALRSALADKRTQLETQRRAMGTSMPGTAAPVAASPPAVSKPATSATPVVVASEPLRPAVAATPPPVVEPLRTPTAEPVSGPTNRPVVNRPPVEASMPPTPAFTAPVPRPDDPGNVELSTNLPNLQPINRPLPNSFLPGNTEAAVLNRIAARADDLNFDRIGRATAADADDLKDIAGIGPFLERKLHSLGIYTYRQIANFTRQDSEQVNEIIEFFPGRVERDNWVGQAKEFHERKYGART